MPETEMTVFERCVEAVEEATPLQAACDEAGRSYSRAAAAAVLTALAEHTGSPRTVDEVLRVLGEASA